MRFFRHGRERHVRLAGGREMRVVGESHYQDALSTAVGGKTHEGAHVEVEATLKAEPTNAFDPNAVVVQVDGRTVGYLAREDAIRYQPIVTQLAREDALATCAALITGGWKRGPDEGHFGIALDLAAPEDCLPRAAANASGAPSEGSFDLVGRAVELAATGVTGEAESLFRRALTRAHDQHDPAEQRFVEGRYADFLIAHGRQAEAKTLLEASVAAGTDLPASLAMLVRLYEDDAEWAKAERLLRREHEVATASATRTALPVPDLAGTILSLAHAGVAHKAREPIDRAINWATDVGEKVLMDAVQHALGALAEAQDDEAGAVELYARLADAGSRHEPTHTRLMILLEKQRRYPEALAAARHAVTLHGSAAFEQAAQARITRLEQKTAPRGSKPARAAIPPFLARAGSELLIWDGPAKIIGGVSALAMFGDTPVAVGIGREAALWTLDATGGTAHSVRSMRSRGLVVTTPTTVLVEVGDREDNKSHFVVLSGAPLKQVAEIAIPDRVTQAASASWGFAIGCRDGSLYTFEADGKAVSRTHLRARPGDDEDSRPVPYYVACAASGRQSFYSSYESVHCLEDGTERWQWSIPPRKQRESDLRAGITLEFNLGSDLVRALVATHDGGALALGNERIWRLDARGSARDVGAGPDQHAQLVVDRVDRPVALSSWGVLRFFEGGTRDVTVGERDVLQLRWSDELELLVAFDGVQLQVYDRAGREQCRYEFTKAITDVLWNRRGAIVAAGQPQFFRLA